MAYSVPERWEHGEFPTAAKVNKYKDALDAVHDLIGDDKINVGTLVNNTVDKGYFFVHRWRWLHYRGDGEIVDPAGAGETEDISGDGSNDLVFDLEQVSWLYPGKVYEVKDVVYALEDETA